MCMVNNLSHASSQNIWQYFGKIVRTIFSISLISVLLLPNPSKASNSTANTTKESKASLSKEFWTPKWIEDFQQETQLSDASITLLIEIFGEEELHDPRSPLRFKFSIIYQTLLYYNIDFITISKTLDAMIASFAEEYATLSVEEKRYSKDTIITDLDAFVPEFMVNFYENGEDFAAVQEEVMIEVAKRSEVRKLIELVREDRERAMAAGQITLEQQDALEQYYMRDSYLDKFEPLPWQKGDWQSRNDLLKAQYFISDKETPYNALVAELLHRVCETLHPLPDGKDEWIPILWNMANTYRTTADLIAYARTVLTGISPDVWASLTSESSSELPTWSSENIFTVLGSLDEVARQISIEKRKSIKPYVFDANDNTKTIEAHFADRPVLELYLKYTSAVSEFPDSTIVSLFRKRKNLDEDMSDAKVIASYDIVPLSGVRDKMKINGKKRSDIEYAGAIKDLRYKTFNSIFDDSLHVKSKNDFLIETFNAFKKWGKQEQKKGVSLSLVPKDTKTVAAMMCYAMVYEKLPDREEVLVLLNQIKEASDELLQLRDAQKEMYIVKEQKSRQDILSTLEGQQEKIIAEMANEALVVLQHPKWTIVTDKALSDYKRWNRDCWVNGRNTMKNIVALTHPNQKSEFVTNYSEFEWKLYQWTMPIWKNGHAYGLYEKLVTREQWYVVEASSKEQLYAQITTDLSDLAVIHNSNVFELFFWTWYYPDWPNKWKRKGHRTPVFLNSTGEWMALDPIKNPANTNAWKRKPFPIATFFDRMDGDNYIYPHHTNKKTWDRTYRCVIDVSSQYGYLHEQTAALLAMVSSNPDVMKYIEEKLWSDAAKYMPYIGQYASFTPPEVTDLIIEDLTIDTLMIIYPDLGSEEDVSYDDVVEAVNGIKNTFDRRTVLGYIRSGDVAGLQRFLSGDEDEYEDEDGNVDPIDTGKYTGILDKKTLRAIQSLNDESYYKEYRAWFSDMWYYLSH